MVAQALEAAKVVAIRRVASEIKLGLLQFLLTVEATKEVMKVNLSAIMKDMVAVVVITVGANITEVITETTLVVVTEETSDKRKADRVLLVAEEDLTLMSEEIVEDKEEAAEAAASGIKVAMVVASNSR